MAGEQMSENAGYAASRDAAYVEIYTALDDLDHARRCDGCRPCEVIKATLEWAMRSLSRNLSQDEFNALAKILAKAETRAVENQESTLPGTN